MAKKFKPFKITFEIEDDFIYVYKNKDHFKDCLMKVNKETLLLKPVYDEESKIIFCIKLINKKSGNIIGSLFTE